MIIAMPVFDRRMQSEVCPSFGRAPYFLIYDTAAKVPEFICNTAAKSSGGAGIKAAQLLVDRGVKVLISPRCGENAAAVLQQADIEIYQFVSGTAQRNITEFSEGKMRELAISPGLHGHEPQ